MDAVAFAYGWLFKKEGYVKYSDSEGDERATGGGRGAYGVMGDTQEQEDVFYLSTTVSCTGKKTTMRNSLLISKISRRARPSAMQLIVYRL